MDWYTGKFVDIQDESPIVKRFWLEVPEIKQFEFTPGQFITLDLPIHEKRAKRMRSYSIASAPDDSNVLELVIVYVEGGAASDYFWNEVDIGTEVQFMGPLGKFVLPEKIDRDLCLICTGTGIGPYRSMLFDLYNKNGLVTGEFDHNIYLIFGTRYSSNLLYRSEMERLTEVIPALDYRVALSREEPPNGMGIQGYVHPIYEELFADQREAYFYLCGWRKMINEARERIQDMGYPKDAIHFEIYG